MNKKVLFSLITIGVVIATLVSFSSSLTVFADLYGNEGTGAGSGGVSTDGTGMFVSTSYGATWEYTTLADVAAGLVPGAHMEGDDVVIDGWGGSGNFSVAGARITGCASFGGFYRYSMVAQKNLGSYRAGDLVGVIGIDGNSSVYNSSMLGGGMNYIGNNWNEVTQAYKTYQDAGIMSLGVGTGRNLSWFCAGDGGGSTVIQQLSCSSSGGTTTMTTRVLNPRLTGAYSNWRNVTYAMPTDDLNWFNCYGPGVQTKWDTFRGNPSYTVISVDGEKFNGHAEHVNQDPEPEWKTNANSYSNIQNYFSLSSWKNYWTLDRNFTPYYQSGQQPGTYNNGDHVGKRLDEKYKVNVGDVGTALSESTGTSQPIVYEDHNYGHEDWNHKTVNRPYSYQEIDYYDKNEVYYPPGWYWGTYVPEPGYHYVDYIPHYKTVVVDPHWVDIYWSHSNDYKTVKIISGPTGDSAEARIPYNFQNEPFVTLGGDSSYIYAGSSINVDKAYVMVGAKGNSVTEAYYSTIVKDAKVKMISYLTPTPRGGGFMSGSGDLCGYMNAKRCNTIYDEEHLTLNGGGSLTGSSTDVPNAAGTYQAYDASAGDYMCFAIAVYPATSGSDYNYTDVGGDHLWAVGNPACKKIVKTPFFGIEGGSLYSAAKISTGSIGKNNIIGHKNKDGNYDMLYDGKITSETKWKYFGSYVEQSIIGTNDIKGLASGSSYLGWIGIENNDFCSNLVPLTFANDGNYYDSNGQQRRICGADNKVAGHLDSAGAEGVDKAAYVDYWLRDVINTGDNSHTDGFGNATRLYSNTGKYIYYTESSQPKETTGEIRIYNDADGNGMTRIVKIKNTLTINHNIVYDGFTRGLTSAGQIPQVIIYANNINISCSVEKIDAILIAEGTVDTCYQNTNHNPNDPIASKRLDVLGVVITDKIALDRTYGAAIDGYTYSPAELFKYDTSILLWARFMASAGESNTMTEVYRTEMAPRF